MKTVQLSDDLSFSAVAQGYWRLDSWGMTTAELVRQMNACIDLGVTTFDTAEIYGDTACETMMGAAFKEDPTIRERIQLVTKTGIFKQEINGKMFGYYDTTYDRVMQSCKESLQRLGTDRIDLYLIHREDQCFDPWETGRALLDLKQKGLIREMGVSNFDPFKYEALDRVVGGQLVTNQIEWNPIQFEHFDSGMIDYLAGHKVHPMAWSPLAGGRMFSKDDTPAAKAMAKITEIAERHGVDPVTIIYAWIMYHPVGAVPIVGSSRIDRLKLAVEAVDVQLEHYEWYEIFTASGQKVLR